MSGILTDHKGYYGILTDFQGFFEVFGILWNFNGFFGTSLTWPKKPPLWAKKTRFFNSNFKFRTKVYLGLGAKNYKNKETFFSPTLKPQEDKVLLVF